jgi:hypothetical protein
MPKSDLLRTREPVVSQNTRDQEPDDQLPSEQSLEEVGNIRRDLVIEFG